MRQYTRFWFLCALQLQAQGIIATVAGTDFVFPRIPVPATAAPTGVVVGVAVAAGNLFTEALLSSIGPVRSNASCENPVIASSFSKPLAKWLRMS
jgi:hypothetical protein